MSKAIKILVTGPESSGKTTLCHKLANELLPNAIVRPEIARSYLEALNRPHNVQDLFNIWQEQITLEDQLVKECEFLICDTAHFVMGVWNHMLFQEKGLYTEQLINAYPADYAKVFLCAPDLPWQPDPLRVNPDPKERQLLYDMYLELLKAHEMNYQFVFGFGEKRYMKILEFSKHLL